MRHSAHLSFQVSEFKVSGVSGFGFVDVPDWAGFAELGSLKGKGTLGSPDAGYHRVPLQTAITVIIGEIVLV